MMKKTISTIILTMMLATVCAQKPAVVLSDKTGWHKIAETTVNFEKDHDEVDILLADKFASLKFKVTDAPMELMDLDVFFEDGGKQNISIGYAIKAAGNESREIDIDGPGERKLDRVIFRYRTLENRKDKKAHVEIWGKKTNADKTSNNKKAGGKK